MLARFARAPAGVEFVLSRRWLRVRSTLLANVISRRQRYGRAGAHHRLRAQSRPRRGAQPPASTKRAASTSLFLDADMLPDSDRFLSIWLGIVTHKRRDVAFGGLSLPRPAHDAETALHHDLFGRSDCRRPPPRARAAQAHGLIRTCWCGATSWLAHPFDELFPGWGFEDTDWALEVARITEILHVDNPATPCRARQRRDVAAQDAPKRDRTSRRLARKHPLQVDALRRPPHRRAAARPPGAQDSTARLRLARARSRGGGAHARCAAPRLNSMRAAHYAEHLA